MRALGAPESRVRFARAAIAGRAMSARLTMSAVFVHVMCEARLSLAASQCLRMMPSSARHTRAMCAWVASASAWRWASFASSASYSASSSVCSADAADRYRHAACVVRLRKYVQEGASDDGHVGVKALREGRAPSPTARRKVDAAHRSQVEAIWVCLIFVRVRVVREEPRE